MTPNATPLVSIVIPTLGRVGELEALLQSVLTSTYRNYEVVIVDQNETKMLSHTLEQYADRMSITHLHVCLRGAARARNYGATFARGDILCFPDDDCELFPNTIQAALDVMTTTRSDVVFGRSVAKDRRDSVTPFRQYAGYLSPKQYEGMFTEFTMFARKAVFDAFKYDESFGIGTFYGSEEAYDLVLRMMKAGVTIFYDPAILFFHPRKVTDHSSSAELRRVFTYRCGFSHLCVRHKLYGKLLDRLVKVCAYIVYLSIFNRGKVRYYVAEVLGLLVGLVVR